MTSMLPFQFYPPLIHPKYNRNNKKHKENQELETPDYFNFISEKDQKQYRDLQQILISPENRYARNRRIETLKESLEEIRKFCLRNDEDDWKRCLVCGVIWLNGNKLDYNNNNDSENDDNNYNKNECISINIRQLKVILGKSKSSINGAMIKMGFTTFPTKGKDQELLIDEMPYFEGKYFEMRQWTIRKRELNQDNKDEENKKSEAEASAEDEISFLSYEGNESEDFRFDGIDVNDQDFWFNYDADKNIFDFNIVNQKEININILIPTSNQSSKTTSNKVIFANAESVLEINNLREISNAFRSNLNDIINSCTCYLNLMIISSLFLLYLTYINVLMAFEAGKRVPRLTY